MQIAVIVPCFRVRYHVVEVIRGALRCADQVICVDDACPENTAALIEETFPNDDRVRVIRRATNGGVGAAMVTGYLEALESNADILVKVDGDGQIDPSLIGDLVEPILRGDADYVKGNRFFSVETVAQMPWARIVGNAGLSFLSKVSTGYWDLFDPNNGFTALEARVAEQLPLERLHKRYFFESDLLFRLGVLRARVVELSMTAQYGNEESNLSEVRSLLTFPLLHLRNFTKRVAYNYFLRNFSIASLNLIVGGMLMFFGGVFGLWSWRVALQTGSASTAGTVMLAALPIILGIQLLLSFVAYDISMTPSQPVHRQLGRRRARDRDDERNA